MFMGYASRKHLQQAWGRSQQVASSPGPDKESQRNLRQCRNEERVWTGGDRLRQGELSLFLQNIWRLKAVLVFGSVLELRNTPGKNLQSAVVVASPAGPVQGQLEV